LFGLAPCRRGCGAFGFCGLLLDKASGFDLTLTESIGDGIG